MAPCRTRRQSRSSGAVATLVGPGAARTATTDDHGAFRFLGIAPGLHTLELGQAGFQSTRLEVTVQPGKSAVVDVTLQVAGAEEAVTVLGELPSQDSRKVETGATYGEQELKTIPTTRDPWAILRQVPGILLSSVNVGGGRGGASTGVVGKGAGTVRTRINVDGVTISLGGFTYAHFDFDSLDSIGVTTGGSDPSLSSPGVTINLVTKRGTNELAGSARALYTDGSQWDYGLELGGPLWKDRIWIWGAGATNSYLGQTDYLPDDDTRPQPGCEPHWNAKLTAQLAPANALTLGYFSHTRLVDGRGAAPDRSEPTTLDITFPTESFKVEDSQVLSKNLFAALSSRTLRPTGKPFPRGVSTRRPTWISTTSGETASSLSVNSRLCPGRTDRIRLLRHGPLRHELKFGFGYRQAHDRVRPRPGRRTSSSALLTHPSKRR